MLEYRYSGYESFNTWRGVHRDQHAIWPGVDTGGCLAACDPCAALIPLKNPATRPTCRPTPTMPAVAEPSRRPSAALLAALLALLSARGALSISTGGVEVALYIDPYYRGDNPTWTTGPAGLRPKDVMPARLAGLTMHESLGIADCPGVVVCNAIALMISAAPHNASKREHPMPPPPPEPCDRRAEWWGNHTLATAVRALWPPGASQTPICS